MAIMVYPWPPVQVIGRSWQVVQPVVRLRSALTGRDQVQSSQRARREVALDVQAVGRDALYGGGYMEQLGALLGDGSAVRLTSWSPNWHLDQPRAFEWLSISLTATAITSGIAGIGAWQVAGLPPNYPLIRPGDRFSVGGVVGRAINAARANAAGVAVIRVQGATAGSGALVIGAEESAVFRPDSIPTGKQTPGKNWSYAWRFREVFADEVGGFTEVSASIWT